MGHVPQMPLLAAAPDPGGITGFLLDSIDALGALGVGLAILLETVIPPIPSELLLPAAGYLVQTGAQGLVPVFASATLGSVLGAVGLNLLGRWLGAERALRLLGRLPLVDVDDVRRGFSWFERHGRWAVLVGRLVPVVRSFVSVPAGVVRMPWPQFLVYTALGSGLWNALLIGAGMALGTQHALVERYVAQLDLALVLAAAIALVLLVVRRMRRRRAPSADG